LARCKSCRLACTTGVHPDSVADAYTTEYYGSSSSKFISIIERTLSYSRRIQAGKITRAWRRTQSAVRPPSVLDIGCGRGQLLAAFASQGASVLGLERQEFPANEMTAASVRVGSLDDPEYAGRQFDIIILWHVLEHLENQKALLEIITDHLSDNGLLIVAVPNFSSLQQRLFTRYWFHLDLPRHLVHLESDWLHQLLLRRGFSIESVSYRDTIQNTYGFIQSALNALAPQRLNEYYRLLKHGPSLDSSTILPTLMWSLLALLILPLAMLENGLGILTRRGATVQIAARWKNTP
jgi:SAM-dependent methyltransferase